MADDMPNNFPDSNALQVISLWLQSEPVTKKRFIEISCDRNLSEKAKIHYLKELIQIAISLMEEDPHWTLLLDKGRALKLNESLKEEEQKS